MSRYVLARVAEDDLREILQFIAEDSGVERALGVHARFEEAFAMLAGTPNVGFVRPQLTGKEVRWWPVFRFLVLYDPSVRPLTILRVLHGARQIEAILGSFHGEL